MKDILNYAPVFIALVVGALGVFFGKGGDRNTLKPISYVFLALVALSGAYGGYDVWSKAKSRKAAEAAAARERDVAKRESADLKGRLADSQRVLELASFDLTRPFRYGIFHIDIGLNADGEPIALKGFTGPFPTFGRGGMQGEVRLKINDVFEFNYDVSSGPGGVVTLAQEGAAPQILKPDSLHCYQNTTGECVGDGQIPVDGAWWVDLIAPEYSHGVRLASSRTLNKLAARALGETSYGVMTFRDPAMTPAEYADVERGVKAMHADLKFYAPMHVAASEECPSAIRLPVSMRLAPTSKLGSIVIDLVPGSGRFSTVECEESPF